MKRGMIIAISIAGVALLLLVVTIFNKEWWWKKIYAKWHVTIDDHYSVTSYSLTGMYGIWRTGRFPDMDVQLDTRGAVAELAGHTLTEPAQSDG